MASRTPITRAPAKPPTWQQEYLQALQARDVREHAFDGICAAYVRLAAAARSAAPAATSTSTTSPADPSAVTAFPPTSPTASPVPAAPASRSPAPEIASLKTDLAHAQRARTALLTQVSELRGVAARLDAAERERARWERRCRDLDAEIRGKDKVIQDVQDELLALNMEVNMVTEREKETRRDNQELLERWMKLKGKEADEMNRAFE